MIALIGNRPVLQVGRYQVSCYDSQWLREALWRAMQSADRKDFPFIDEICEGIFDYLENKCPLRMLPLPSLFDKMRRMLEQIGCETIARALHPVAPPVQLDLLRLLEEKECRFELSLFTILRQEMAELVAAGAYEIRVTRLRESVQMIHPSAKWNRDCERLKQEIEVFLQRYEPTPAAHPHSGSLVMHFCAES